jgi:hypothetical protein
LGLSLVLMWWVWCEGLRSWEQASFKIGFGTDPRDLSRVECMIGASVLQDVGVAVPQSVNTVDDGLMRL